MIKPIKKKLFFSPKFDIPKTQFYLLFFLGFCLILGTILRFTLLISKPIWTDEFATLVFSLGNNYNSVPINEIITIDQLLKPLEYNPDANIREIASLLINEDNHPPLYFVLANLWYKLFSHPHKYLSLTIARSLPAFLSLLSIPAIYYLAKISFLSRQNAYLATWLMTVSPYSIYLAQEARHYSLGILLVIASICCLVTVIKLQSQLKVIPFWLFFLWGIINVLGFLTHYFFLITLVSEAIALVIYYFNLIRKKNKYNSNYLVKIRHNLVKICWLAIAIFLVTICWFVFIIPQDYGNDMTSWIESDKSSFLAIISPVFQLIATLITMVSLLPVESTYLPLVIVSGLMMILFFIWLLPQVFTGIKLALRKDKFKIIQSLLIFCLTSITIFLLITYGLNLDITRGARYSFVYFPVVILLVAISLSNNQFFSQPKNILILACMGLLSSVTVTSNLGYQKYYRPDLLIPIINHNSEHNILIATTHQTLVQTGEMMGIAWQLKDHKNSAKIKFLLAHQNYQNDPKATLILQEKIKNIDSPLDLWLVNFYAPIKLNNCFVNNFKKFPSIDGYNYDSYRCFPLK